MNYKHGWEGTPTYTVWVNMKGRCRNPRDRAYADYGGRGIAVCDRWLSFENFLADMGPKPGELQLDRVNNDGNYEPGNCRWATPAENARHRRSTVRYTYQGTTATLKALCEQFGKNYNLVKRRVIHGWPVAKAMDLEATNGGRPKGHKSRNSSNAPDKGRSE